MLQKDAKCEGKIQKLSPYMIKNVLKLVKMSKYAQKLTKNTSKISFLAAIEMYF